MLGKQFSLQTPSQASEISDLVVNFRTVYMRETQTLEVSVNLLHNKSIGWYNLLEIQHNFYILIHTQWFLTAKKETLSAEIWSD